MVDIPDVDLDLPDREKALVLFPEAIVSSQLVPDGSKMVKHNTGMHFQHIPIDPINSLASFPYDIAEQLGYYKIDLINYQAYDGVRDESHLIELMEFAEHPDFPWYWFKDERFFSNPDTSLQITHLARHYELCVKYPPRSVLDVAALIALIRPRKNYLIGSDWSEIEEKIWLDLEEEKNDKPGGYFFKKSHAVAFALVILVQMQLLNDLV